MVTMPPVGYEGALVLTVADELRRGLADHPTLARFQFPGERAPKEAPEEWVEYHPLSILPMRRPRQSYQAVVLFQVSCFSKLAEFRSDKDAHRPWRIAGVVTDLLQRKDLKVYEIGPEGDERAVLGVLSIHEPEQQYLNQRMSRSQGPRQFGNMALPDNTIHLVALTFRAVTNVHI